ncbi:MAG: diadenylate cyclase CdaA [Lentisphaeria bacterium]|nr:diadenylate cyclase CdaA [Lentisphaeria bacterium]
MDFLKAALQVAILFIVINQVLYYLRNTRGSLVLAGGLIGVVALAIAANKLDLLVIKHILSNLYGSALLALIIVFQPELRRALAQLGSLVVREGKRRREFIGELVAAVRDMSLRKCGALIVVERRMKLQTLIDDSIPLDIKVNSLILESIFYPNSPLHDGAVIIRDDRILAARVILPLTRAEHISRSLGTRHRAALGISEESDAVSVTVSEETGAISVACRGDFHRDLTIPVLERLLEQLIVQRDDSEVAETMLMAEEMDSSNQLLAAENAEKEAENAQ